MPKRRRSELAAGLFVIATLAVALCVVLWLGAADVFRPARARAFFYTDEQDGSTGLGLGKLAQINDKQIGKIVAIRYLPAERRTLYQVEIDEKGLEIRSDAIARVISPMIGESRLVITSRGTAGRPPADEKNAVHITGGLEGAIDQLAEAAQKVNSFLGAELDRSKSGAFLAKAHRIADNLDATTTLLAKLMANFKPETEPGNEKSMFVQVRGTIADIRAAAADMRAIAADARPKVGRMLTSAADAAERIDQYAKTDIPEIFATLRNANDKILTIANDFAAVSETTKKIIVLNRDNIDTMIDNMTQVSATLKATSEEIRANPWRLTHRPTKEELHTYSILTAATAFSQGASSLDQAINKLKNLDPKMFKTDDPQVQQIRAHLNESFKKFKEVEDALWQEMQTRPQ